MAGCEQMVYNYIDVIPGVIQTFVVPENVTAVSIEAIGAAGGTTTNGGGTPGRGARISGFFHVNTGDTLSILVGGKGHDVNNNPNRSGGGGGGSFVWRGTGSASLANILIAAGGGGGGACSGVTGVDASITTSGTASNGNPSGAGGTGGLGGGTGAPHMGEGQGSGGGGAGIIGNGATSSNGGVGGTAISAGGAGGAGNSGGDGGFGGGGGAAIGGGGGGGYSGGGGAGSLNGCGGGGGGGSYNGGDINYQINQAGVGTGNGSVTIRFYTCGNIVTSNDTGLCSKVVNFSGVNNCPGVTITCVPPSGSTFPVGVTSVTCTAILSGFPIGACTFTVTVNDTEPPSIQCPANMDAAADPDTCGANVTYPPATATDNCAVASVNCSPASGSFFPVGVNTVTCTATDDAGNTATCTFTITVHEDVPPTVTCPPDMTVPTDSGLCTAVVNYPPATVEDNCPGATVTCVPPSGSTFNLGPNTVTCTGTDASGNTATCTFTITVVDTEAPVVICPPDMTVSTDPGVCTAAVNYPPATATDNCTLNPTVVCTPASGSTFNLGPNTVTCTATDEAGNTATCSFTITVVDNEAPVVTCPPDMTVSTDPGVCTAVVNYPPATATDNCTLNPTVVCTPASGSTFNLGPNTVTCTATDEAGNTATCKFTITVVDNQPPVVHCPANKVVNAEPGKCSAVVTFTATVDDNCPGATVTCVPPSGSTFLVGTTTVTCTGRDASGNTATCSFTVTVVDNQPPVVHCPANMTVIIPSDQTGVVVNYPPATVSDNCPGATVNCVPPSGSIFPVGTTTVICTGRDASGNTAECSFTVTVKRISPIRGISIENLLKAFGD